MVTSYGSLSDDFYVNMTLSTELELPSERDTILHFFERIQRQFPTMNNFYQRESGEFCLDEDRETGSYRWISIEQDRICSGYVNPNDLNDADELHKLILELIPYMLGVNHLDVASLDILYGMDFDYQGNHDEILADALFSETPFMTLLDYPEAKPIGFDPAVIISLSPDCRLQAKISLESRTGAYQVRTGKYKNDEQISLYLSIRQYPDPTHKFNCVLSYDRQKLICEQIMNEKVIPGFVKPILGAIAQRQ